LNNTKQKPNRPDGELFRREALQHYSSAGNSPGDVLRLSPSWLGWTYRLLVGCFAASVLFLCCGRAQEFAEGPAVVRAGERIDVTTDVAAIVSEVLVSPGQRVETGELLVRLDDARERAQVDRYKREMAASVAASLRNPGDESSRGQIRSLRSQLDHARRQLALRGLTAPTAGIVLDVRTRSGQSLQPGKIAVTIQDGAAAYTLVAALPGHFKPQLEAGMPARLEINGYPHSFQHVELLRVADEIVGPAEARRYLGQEIADAIPLSGPVVLAEVALPGNTFTVDGVDYPYTDGLQGVVQIRVRSMPIIVSLVPGLRSLRKGTDHGFSP